MIEAGVVLWWLACSALWAYIAHLTGRSPAVWFVVSMAISPILAFAAFFFPSKEDLMTVREFLRDLLRRKPKPKSPAELHLERQLGPLELTQRVNPKHKG